MKTKTADNRRHGRQLCLVPVESKEGTAFDKVQTIDISRGGIGFLSKQAIPLNEQIAVEIELAPDADPVLVVGRVQWVRKVSDSDNYRIGIKFVDILMADYRSRLLKHFPE